MKPWREYREPRAGEVESYLSRHCNHVSRESHKNGTTEVRFRPSPCCGHNKRPACTVNASSGLWSCKVCRKVGNWFTLTRSFGDPLPESDRYKGGNLDIPWDAFAAQRAKARRPVTMGHYPDLLEYCRFRGFSDKTLDAWRVTTKGPKALRWPIYAWTGKTWDIANARIRVVIDRDKASTADWFEVKGGPTGLAIGNHLLGIPNWPKEEYPPNEQNEASGASEGVDPNADTPQGPLTHQNGDKRLIVTEGQWDAMTAWELGLPNVISLPHGAAHMNVAQLLRYVPDDWEIWLALDMDEPGQLAVEKAFAQLGCDRVARIEMPYKDLNAWYTEDPTLTAKDVLNAAVGITKTIQTRQGLMKPNIALVDDDSVSFDMSDNTGPKLICETPWKGLTKVLSGGFKGGATTGLLAPSGRGKTTIANQIAVHAASLGTKVGVIMLEDTRANVSRIITQQAAGWTGLTGDPLKTVLAKIRLSKLEGTKVNWQECGKQFERYIEQGCQLLILDNLDYIMPRVGGDGNSEKIQAYGLLTELAKESNTHIVVVWQPNKVDPKKIVTSVDQKGLSQAYQDADNYLNLNWFGNLRRLELEKHRENGVKEDGAHVWLTYDDNTRCMIEVPAKELEIQNKGWDDTLI